MTIPITTLVLMPLLDGVVAGWLVGDSPARGVGEGATAGGVGEGATAGGVDEGATADGRQNGEVKRKGPDYCFSESHFYL